MIQCRPAPEAKARKAKDESETEGFRVAWDVVVEGVKKGGVACVGLLSLGSITQLLA